eukprot:scaffold578_cov243-Pinguiococcus_pyrenoidosus.AAC.27
MTDSGLSSDWEEQWSNGARSSPRAELPLMPSMPSATRLELAIPKPHINVNASPRGLAQDDGGFNVGKHLTPTSSADRRGRAKRRKTHHDRVISEAMAGPSPSLFAKAKMFAHEEKAKARAASRKNVIMPQARPKPRRVTEDVAELSRAAQSVYEDKLRRPKPRGRHPALGRVEGQLRMGRSMERTAHQHGRFGRSRSTSPAAGPVDAARHPGFRRVKDESRLSRSNGRSLSPLLVDRSRSVSPAGGRLDSPLLSFLDGFPVGSPLHMLTSQPGTPVTMALVAPEQEAQTTSSSKESISIEEELLAPGLLQHFSPIRSLTSSPHLGTCSPYTVGGLSPLLHSEDLEHYPDLLDGSNASAVLNSFQDDPPVNAVFAEEDSAQADGLFSGRGSSTVPTVDHWPLCTGLARVVGRPSRQASRHLRGGGWVVDSDDVFLIDTEIDQGGWKIQDCP